MLLQHKKQSVNAVSGNNRCLLSKSYETHQQTYLPTYLLHEAQSFSAS